MKKILFFTIGILLFFPAIVLAEEPYYTNYYGVTLTEEQYNNLAKAFSADTIYTMSAVQINPIKDDTTLKSTISESYYRTDSYYNYLGELTGQTELEVSENDYELYEQPMISLYTTGIHETNMKKITLSITTGALDVRYITVTNTWKSIPSVKSYDIIAVRIDTTATLGYYQNEDTKGLITGHQIYDGVIQAYDGKSSNLNVVWKNSIIRTVGGVGLSMNILDSVTTSLVNELTVVVNSGATFFTARGTYQHAQSDVSLADSKKYTINSAGMGGVVNFTDSTVAGKYDQTGGVTVTHYSTDL